MTTFGSSRASQFLREDPEVSSRPSTDAILTNGDTATVRPLLSADSVQLSSFVARVDSNLDPGETLALSWQDGIRRWFDGSNPDQMFASVVLARDRIIALGFLTHASEGPLRWSGDVTVVIEEAYRNLGVGDLLMQDFLRIAKSVRLDRLVVSIMADRDENLLLDPQRSSQVNLTVFRDHYRDSFGAGRHLAVVEMPQGRWNTPTPS